MQKELAKEIIKHAGESEFSNRLIEITKQIEREFQGDEQKHLLELVRETLNRHIEIRDNTRRAHVALKQLEADQQALLQLFSMITSCPETETLH